MPLSKYHILSELSASEELTKIGSFGMNCKQLIVLPLCGNYRMEYIFCLFKSQRVMLEPSPLTLASKLKPIVVSEEKDSPFIEPSVYLKVKSTSSLWRFTKAISPSE